VKIINSEDQKRLIGRYKIEANRLHQRLWVAHREAEANAARGEP
jgi:hypothetical protein